MNIGDYPIIINMTTAENSQMRKILEDDNIIISGRLVKPIELLITGGTQTRACVIIDKNKDETMMIKNIGEMIEQTQIDTITLVKIMFKQQCINKNIEAENKITLNLLKVKANKKYVNKAKDDDTVIIIPNVNYGIKDKYQRQAEMVYWDKLQFKVMEPSENDDVTQTNKLRERSKSIRQMFSNKSRNIVEERRQTESHSTMLKQVIDDTNQLWFYTQKGIKNIITIDE